MHHPGPHSAAPYAEAGASSAVAVRYDHYTSPPPMPAVPGGPRAYRRQIRAWGGFAALVVPALLGAGAWWLHRGSSTTATGAGSFALAVLAAPGLLVAGVPLRSGGSLQAGVLGSAVLWFVIGAVAAARSTKRPAATWRDYWTHYGWMAAGVWVGVVGAGVIANLLVGRALF